MEVKQDLAPLVARVSEVVAARLEEVAAETGVSYHTLYAWGRGRRNVNSRHLRRLAEVVRRRAVLLWELAAELDERANGGSGTPRGEGESSSAPKARRP